MPTSPAPPSTSNGGILVSTHSHIYRYISSCEPNNAFFPETEWPGAVGDVDLGQEKGDQARLEVAIKRTISPPLKQRGCRTKNRKWNFTHEYPSEPLIVCGFAVFYPYPPPPPAPWHGSCARSADATCGRKNAACVSPANRPREDTVHTYLPVCFVLLESFVLRAAEFIFGTDNMKETPCASTRSEGVVRVRDLCWCSYSVYKVL